MSLPPLWARGAHEEGNCIDGPAHRSISVLIKSSIREPAGVDSAFPVHMVGRAPPPDHRAHNSFDNQPRRDRFWRRYGGERNCPYGLCAHSGCLLRLAKIPLDLRSPLITGLSLSLLLRAE